MKERAYALQTREIKIEKLILVKQFLYRCDDFVAFSAPVGRDEHFAWTFAAETFDGDIRTDNFDHFGDSFAVFLGREQLDVATGEILRHDSPDNDM